VIIFSKLITFSSKHQPANTSLITLKELFRKRQLVVCQVCGITKVFTETSSVEPMLL